MMSRPFLLLVALCTSLQIHGLPQGGPIQGQDQLPSQSASHRHRHSHSHSAEATGAGACDGWIPPSSASGVDFILTVPSGLPSAVPSASDWSIPSSIPANPTLGLPTDGPSSITSSGVLGGPSGLLSSVPSDTPLTITSGASSMVPSGVPADIPSNASPVISSEPSNIPISSGVPSSGVSSLPSNPAPSLASALPSIVLSGVSPSPSVGAQGGSGGSATGSCSCGYVLTAYNNSYFPHHNLVTFDSLPEGPLSSSDALDSLGWSITSGQMGATNPKTGLHSVSTYQNFAIDSDKALTLTVPGGQSSGNQGAISATEMSSSMGFVNGVFTGSFKFSSVSGTCQTMFTYHNESNGQQDEQDIEVLGAALMDAAPNGTPPGMEFTNWDPTDESNSERLNTIVAFPQDPTVAYHNYTIAWLTSGTSYYFDGTPANSPNGFSSKNPSKLLVSQWTDGDTEFTYGPPAQDAVMGVKALDYYYSLSAGETPPSGCTVEDACKV